MFKAKSVGILLTLVVALPGLGAPARQSSPPPDNDRVPTKDLWQMFPRWTRFGIQSTLVSSKAGMAVQNDGAVHFIYQAGSGATANASYVNNRPEGRTRTGVSAPLKLNTVPSVTPGHIAVGKDGRLTAVYLAFKSSTTGGWNDLYSRQFDPTAGSWGAETQLTFGSDSTSSTTGIHTTITYGQPTLSYDGSGIVHLVYGEQNLQTSPSINLVMNTIKYSPNLGSPTNIDTGTRDLNAGTGAAPDVGFTISRQGIPTVAAAPDGTPHFVWSRTSSTNTVILYASNAGGQTTLFTFSNNLASPNFDASVDESGGLHLAYVSTTGTTSRQPTYRFKASQGLMGSPELIPFSSGFGADDIRIAVNARKKPVVLWSNTFGTSSATKVLNTVTDLLNSWVEQFALDQNGVGATTLNAIGIDRRTGFIHAIYDGGEYIRSTELNTGIQDGFTMVPFGPNATANVATGNLRIEVPLFAARSGIGFGTNFSLIYNSLNAERAAISPGWSTPFDMYVVDTGDPTDAFRGGTLHTPEGQIITFAYDFNQGTALAPPEFGNFSKLDVDQPLTGQYRLTTKSGMKYIFDSSGRLKRMEDTQSTPNTMTFTYTNGLLSMIQDSPSRQTMLVYDSSKRLQTVTDPAGNTYTLAYQTPTGTNVEPGRLETVNFDGAPSGQTVKWKFQYYTENNFDQSANPPLERHTGLLSDVFTPRGQALSYSYQFGYKLDSRVVSSTEPNELSVTDDTSLSGFSTSSVQARREIAYVDPAEPLTGFDAPYIDEGPTPTMPRISPAAQVKDRRGNVTTIEYEAARCLADRVRDPIIAGQKQVLRRFFDTFLQPQDMAPPITVPRYRNLKHVIDREGNSTQYFYTFEEGSQEMPTYVKDNLRRISQPPANFSDIQGPSGAPDSVDTAVYTYADKFARVATVTDALQNKTVYTYDFDGMGNGAGNLTLITYPLVTGQGQALESFVYDGSGRVTSHKAPEQGATNYTAFDGSTGLVTSFTLPDHGNPETFQYDLMGNTKQHTLPEGGVTSMNYNNLYQVHDMTPPAGGTGDSASLMTVYTYNEDGQVIQVDAPENSGSMSIYDHLGRPTQSQVKSSSGTFNTFYKYDRDGNTREVKDPNQKLSTSIYDELSRVKKSQNPGPPFVITQTTYNLNGAVATQVTGSSTTTMTYSGRGLLLKSSNGGFSSQTDETHYFEDGTVDHSTHQVSGTITNQTKNGYDNRRRLISTLQVSNLNGGMGFTTFYGLDRDGNHTSVTDPDGRITFMEYDKADRQTVTRDNNGAFLSRNIFDNNDRVATRTKADPQSGAEITDVVYGYSARNELKTATDANGKVTTYFYDARGNQLKATPPPVLGSSSDTVRIYDVAGRLVQETRGAGTGNPSDQSIWIYEYDANGNRTKITDPRGFVYVFKYDDGNRLIEIDYPTVAAGSFTETWTYDDRGNMLTRTDPNGKVATMTYDLLNRQKTEVHVKSTVTLANLQKDYDERGNLVYVWDSVSQVVVAFAKGDGSTAYDALGRLTEVNWYLNATSVVLSSGTLTQNGQSFARVQYQTSGGAPGYDGAGNLTDMIDPQGNSFHYTYDLNGRLTGIQRTHSGTQSLIAQISYYVSGLKKDVTYLGNSKETRMYDAKYRLQSISLKNPSATEIGHIDYLYDERDRVTSANYPLLTRLVSYSYDLQDRLKSEQWTSGAAPTPPGGSNNIQNLTEGNLSPFTDPVCATPSSSTIVYTANWFYDASGNRTSKSVNGQATTDYEYDEQNRLLDEKRNGVVVVSYGYDNNGNQTSRVENSVIETFSMDYRNRVKAYTKGSSVVYSYLFTPTDQRIAKINVQTNSNVEEWYMYDGQDVTADYTRTTTLSNPDPARTLVRTYVNGRVIDSKIARIEAGEAVYFYSGDSIGSVHEMITNLGAIVRRSLYTAWGEDLGDSASEITFADRFSFSQRESDTESSLMHYRARSMDPRTGRFIQTDPLKERFGTLAQYVYGLNNPILNSDPTGAFVKGDHGKITREAFENVVSRTPSLNSLTDKQGKNRILFRYFEEKLVLANWQTDEGVLFDDLKRHFNADPGKGPEHLQQMKRAFEFHMGSLARDLGALQGSSPAGEISLDEKQKSMRMLRLMGYMLHSIQDFYAHGVDEAAHPDEGTQKEVIKEGYWDFFSKGKTTSPFNPTGFRPSTYATWGFGEHPGRTLPTVGRVIAKGSIRGGGEPALSDLEYQARKKGALRSSEEALERYLGKWGEASLNLGWKVGIIGGELSVDGERLNMMRAP